MPPSGPISGAQPVPRAQPVPQPHRRGRGGLACALLATALLVSAACSSRDDALASTTTARDPVSTMATTAVPPTTASTDPLDVAFAAAGYQTPVPEEIRGAVHTACTASAADLSANLTEAMRAPLEIGIRVQCPERLADLAAAPARG
jgi:hypothetical protein